MWLIQRKHLKVFSFARAASVTLFAIALISAQSAGVSHRIWHAPWTQSQASSWPGLSSNDDHGNDRGHDCAAYDAATLADGTPSALPAPVAALPVHFTSATLNFAVTDNSPHLPFQSRAPPRA
ncbi:MAG: hypothetical protein H0V16_02120 [Burkholderiaceae bacterium]|nr:hypothetical protein [Burkholderiaceae bacterium]